jgi:hypothetical protein
VLGNSWYPGFTRVVLAYFPPPFGSTAMQLEGLALRGTTVYVLLICSSRPHHLVFSSLSSPSCLFAVPFRLRNISPTIFCRLSWAGCNCLDAAAEALAGIQEEACEYEWASAALCGTLLDCQPNVAVKAD